MNLNGCIANLPRSICRHSAARHKPGSAEGGSDSRGARSSPPPRKPPVPGYPALHTAHLIHPMLWDHAEWGSMLVVFRHLLENWLGPAFTKPIWIPLDGIPFISEARPTQPLSAASVLVLIFSSVPKAAVPARDGASCTGEAEGRAEAW